MIEHSAVPLIVLSATREAVEEINGMLRRAGEPAHCTWIPALRDLGDALTQINPELLVHVIGEEQELEAVIAIRDQLAAGVPVLAVAQQADERAIARALMQGARDLVSLDHPDRLQAVMMRELATFRAQRTLDAAQRAAQDARSQLDTVLERSNDAIIQVQEGIVTDANPAWLELFGVEEGIVGQPVMDLFEESTHPALRGALAACLQGRWGGDHTLRANALPADGSILPVEIALALGEYDGGPSVRLVVPSAPRAPAAPVEPRAAAPATPTDSYGLLPRRELLEALGRRLATRPTGGMRCLAVVKLDKFASLERVIGVTASEEVVSEFVRLLRETVRPKELSGRLGGMLFVVLLERGNEHDISAWAEQLLARVQKHVMRIRDKSVSVTCSIGLSTVSPGRAGLDAVVADALEACRKSSARGGNQSVISGHADTESRVASYDKVWVKHIKAALMENRFRLVQQPIASLRGEDPAMFDVLVRMVDTQGKEVLPSEFMAAAARNDLMKNIDRWVVGASLSFAAQKKPQCLFVRLSRETVKDDSFLTWLDNHLRSSRAEPQRLCFQVTEESAASHIPQVKALASALRQRHFRFALESFGGGRDSLGMLESVSLDFVKIDGAVIQGLAADPQLQQRVRALVDLAQKRSVQTVGERVEDANTMAVLWQLGVQYIQGYFVHEPEEVVLSAGR
ncbi:MAG TPA: EAL domain-containing protein [Steroidobacteraceae bacterium]|nr:EAL domain-containing protein [Steroidobacteraceae bacterium]